MTHPAPHGTHTAHEHVHVETDLAEILDLDAEVLAEHIAAVTASLPTETDPRHIVDLGCGTGAGTLALLRRFPNSRVTAVDSAPAHLDRLRDKAVADGVDERLRIVRADLDTPTLPDLGRPELVWASASMHHMSDPDRTLRQVRELLSPGGVFLMIELAAFPRFLPPAAPADSPGLEDRCHAAIDREHAATTSHRGADWTPKLTAAGFTIESENTRTLHVPAARNPAVTRYAHTTFTGLRTRIGRLLTPEDRTALDRLLDPESPQSLRNRDDLALRTRRTTWTTRAG
ncbi:class I SAM-dependent methyltransferase [Embleya hyalina]|uniref:SAM-dependent methyltransferase n=1 Tax=Embleya hyalina TaxID=516124 RepID=A0A401YDK4_9ACTN|nr:class I SAM-dependent methyltransferase [Embleya hyalina]GCD92689.1 SAM-dependent methyltransferase [Embleya hyalina]